MLDFELLANLRLCTSFAIKNFKNWRVLGVAPSKSGRMSGAKWREISTAGLLVGGGVAGRVGLPLS